MYISTDDADSYKHCEIPGSCGNMMPAVFATAMRLAPQTNPEMTGIVAVGLDGFTKTNLQAYMSFKNW